MSFKSVAKNKKTEGNKARAFFLSFVMGITFVIGGCSFSGNDASKSAFSGRDVSEARKVEIKQNIGITDLREIAESDGQQTANASGVQTLNSSFLELKTNRLFDENLRDDDDRFDRVEYAVQDIKDDFDKMTPAINRLISIESDIKELHKQLSILVDNGSLDEESKKAKDQVHKNASNNGSSASTSRKMKNKTATAKPSKTVSSLQMSVGDHATKTRVVFKTPNKQNFNTSFDIESQLVTIESDATISESILKAAVRQSNRIMGGSSDLQSSANNTIVFSTKNIQGVSKGSYIAPTPQKNYHRYYFDLFY